MTQDEIIEMARQAGFEIESGMFDTKAVCVDGVSITRDLEAFAKLAEARGAAKEREAFTFRCWTTEMNDAWNRAIPDLRLAFDELIRIRGEA